MKYAVFTHTIDNKKIKVRNSIITFIFFALGLSASAQHPSPPKTYWQSFGYQKQPDHIKRAYYKSDSLGYEPTMAEVISFNKDGFIIQEYKQVLGKMPREVACNYVYKNGVLDSINILETNASYNSWQKMHYDRKGKLVKITATGKYSEYTDTFTYDEGGMIQTVFRKKASGGNVLTEYVHNRSYVKVTTTETSGRKIESAYIYDGDHLFAEFTITKKLRIRFYDEARRINYQTTDETISNPFEYAMNLRTEYQKNPNALAQKFDNSDYAEIVFDIPAEVNNEHGDWIRQLQLDRTYRPTQRRLVFNQIMYADGTKSGSTEMDLIFESKVRKMK